jgi:phage antirepressor YoqD-like protein
MMTSTLSKFIFRAQEPEQAVRTVTINGGPWFVAADVCAILGLDNVSLAVNGRADREDSGLPEKDRGIASVNTPSGAQQMLAVSKNGICRLVFKSRKAEALKFQDWIFDEVIPALMETGTYGVPRVPQTMEEALEFALVTLRQNKTLTLQAEADRPKIEFFDAVANTDDAILIGDFAKVLGFGPVRFFEMLRDDRVLYRKNGWNLPFQNQIDAGHFRVVETTRPASEPGKTHVQFTTRVLAKGQDYLRKKYAPVSALN